MHPSYKLQSSSNTSEENRKLHFITSGVVYCKVKVGVCQREKVFATCTLFSLWICERTSVSRDIITAIYTDTKFVHVELVHWRIKLLREQGKPWDFLTLVGTPPLLQGWVRNSGPVYLLVLSTIIGIWKNKQHCS